MNQNTAAKGKFKSKGAGILQSRKSCPDSMKEFLGDPSAANTTANDKGVRTNAQNRINAIAHLHRSANAQNHKIPADFKTDKTERLHVHIRKDLADKMLEMVFKRKCDRNMKKHQATQRVIIEEALELYFSRRNT